MEISPYLIGILSIALLVSKEFILGFSLLSICVAQILMPNLNIVESSRNTYIRLGLTAMMFFSLIAFVIVNFRK
jgi:hypothetical protein